MKHTLVFVVLSLFLFGCTGKNQPNETALKPSPDPKKTTAPAYVPTYVVNEVEREKEYNLRSPIRNEFLSALKELVDVAKSPEHTALYEFIKTNGFLALPAPNNCIPVEQFSRENGFAIVVLQEEDSKLGVPWAGMLTNLGAGAVWMPDNKTMVLSPEMADDPESKALILLHEGYHAYGTMVHGEMPVDAESFCLGEVYAYEFVSELTFKVYPKLKTLVEKASTMFQTVSEDGSITVKNNAAVFEFIDAGLDAAYARRITNPKERTGLKIDAFYLANFQGIDRFYSSQDDARAAKVGFIKDYLERAGTAQWPH